ncbi:MAG: hypothetical protein ACRDPY_01000 [Streptosporangiaceae bacterium]
MAPQHAIESWIAAHRRASYTIHGIFVELSIEQSVSRSQAMHRRGHDEYRQGRGHGGRYVPPAAIRALADDPAQRPVQDAAGIVRGSCVPDGGVAAQGEVTTMIRSYLDGEMTLGALCREFGSRRWPAVLPVTPMDLGDAAAAIDDPEPWVPGSFDDVVRAYDRGWITDPDYEALAAAAAASIRRHRG